MSKIKVIAPLEPAGNFKVANAQDIGYADEDAEETTDGTLSAAVFGLRQAVGLTGGSQESIADKLGTAAKSESTPGAGDGKKATGLYAETAEIKELISSSTSDLEGDISGISTTLGAKDGKDPTGLYAETYEIKDLLGTTADAIQSLREHINTINPPTLKVTGGGKVHLVNATPTTTITVSINRYLESPLEIFVEDGATYSKLDFGTSYLTKDYTWQTTSASIGTKTIKVLYINNSNGLTSDGTALPANSITLESKDVSCSFTLPVYWFQSEAESITALPDEYQDNSKKLTYGHPSSIDFSGTGYCYYLYPTATAFSTPRFMVNGQDQSAGFQTENNITLEFTDSNDNKFTHSYVVYRSAQSLENTTVKFS